MRRSPVGFRPVRSLAAVVSAALALGCDGEPPRTEPGRIERLGNDVLAGGPAVMVSENVAGDAILAGGQIRFDGTTRGDYLGAGGEQTIRGTIGTSARAAGGEITLDAEVGRNATLAGGRIVSMPGSVVRGNAYVAGGEIHLAGTVEGGARTAGGRVVLDGVVGGDVRVEAGEMVVGPGARIGGDFRYRVPEEGVSIDPGAQIAGEIVALRPPQRMGWRWFGLLWGLGFLVTGAVAVALFPRFAHTAASALRAHPGTAVGFGLAWLIVVPIAATIAAVTLVGLPLAMIVFALYAISLYLAPAVFSLWLGGQILRDRTPERRTGRVLDFLLGGAILVIAGLIPLLGPLVALAATVLGVGAIVATIWARRTAGPEGDVRGAMADRS